MYIVTSHVMMMKMMIHSSASVRNNCYSEVRKVKTRPKGITLLLNGRVILPAQINVVEKAESGIATSEDINFRI